MKQVVIGRAGSGKTHYITERIKEDLAAGYENILIIVPDQFTFETERELIRQTGKGLFAIRVLSIRRLIDVLRDEVGTKGCRVLDDVNKAMFVNKLLYDYDNELSIYKNAYRTPGFSYDMAKAVTEFKQFGVSYEDLDNLEVFGKTKSKILDIGEIYKAYTNFSGGFLDNEDIINTVTNRLKNSRLIQGSRIYIDHFDVFTHQGYAMIEEMAKVCSSLCVCLCTDGSTSGLFSMTTKTLEQIRQSVPDMETVELKRREGDKDISFLEANLFTQKPQERQGGDGSVELFSFGTVLSEVDHAVAKIIELKNMGYSYMDICLMTGDLDEYGPLIRQTLHDCGIPYFLDEKIPLISNRLAKFLLFSLKNCYSFEAENYIGMIKQGVLKVENEIIAPDVIDRYENYIITKGLKKALTPIEGDTEADALRKAIRITGFKKAVTKAETAEQLAEAVLDYFTNQDVYLNTEIEERAYQKLVDILERMGEIFGDMDMDVRLFTSILNTGIATMDLGVIPEKQDSIIIGDISRTKIERAKCLLVLGVRDGQIPKVTQKSGLISDYDATLIGSQVKLGRDSYDLNSLEQLLTYKMLSKPSEYLYLSFSQRDLYGKECDNQMLFKKVKSILKLPVNMDIPFNEDMSLRLLKSKALAYKNLIAAAFQGENNYITRGVMAYFEREKNTFDLLRPKEYDLSITREQAEEIYSGTRISASRIETYNRCAFSQFLRYGLGLRERKEFAINNMDTGSLLHSMMEKFSKALIEQQGDDVYSRVAENISPMVDQVMEDLLTDDDNAVFSKDKASEAMVSRIKQMSKTALRSILDDLKTSDFVIKYSEADLRQLGNYSIADKPLIGRIDRIDEGKKYIRIIDYKKGASSSADPAKIYGGIQLQLLLYMNAALGHYENKLPGTMEYYIMSPQYTKCDSIGKFLNAEPKEKTSSISATSGKAPISDEQMNKLLAFGQSKAVDAVQSMYSGDIAIRPYKLGDRTGCEYCEYMDVCKNSGEENTRVLDNKKSLDEIVEEWESKGGKGDGLE